MWVCVCVARVSQNVGARGCGGIRTKPTQLFPIVPFFDSYTHTHTHLHTHTHTYTHTHTFCKRNPHRLRPRFQNSCEPKDMLCLPHYWSIFREDSRDKKNINTTQKEGHSSHLRCCRAEQASGPGHDSRTHPGICIVHGEVQRGQHHG